MGRKVTIQIESIEAGMERLKTTWKSGKTQGELITFETLEVMLKTLTSRRWALISVLQRHGPMGVRALARQLDRDVKNVHTDVQALKAIGLVEDCDEGVWVPYDEIEAHLRVAA